MPKEVKKIGKYITGKGSNSGVEKENKAKSHLKEWQVRSVEKGKQSPYERRSTDKKKIILEIESRKENSIRKEKEHDVIKMVSNTDKVL